MVKSIVQRLNLSVFQHTMAWFLVSSSSFSCHSQYKVPRMYLIQHKSYFDWEMQLIGAVSNWENKHARTDTCTGGGAEFPPGLFRPHLYVPENQ